MKVYLFVFLHSHFQNNDLLVGTKFSVTQILSNYFELFKTEFFRSLITHLSAAVFTAKSVHLMV